MEINDESSFQSLYTRLANVLQFHIEAKAGEDSNIDHLTQDTTKNQNLNMRNILWENYSQVNVMTKDAGTVEGMDINTTNNVFFLILFV